MLGDMFTTAGGVPANYIAKWDGSAWSALGSGTNNIVKALAVSGGDLYAGGASPRPAASPPTTSPSGTAAPGPPWVRGWIDWVDALAVSGGDLYVGGLFTTADGVTVNNIAKWDGSTWSPWAGMDGWVDALAVSGSDLYAGGMFTTAGGVTSQLHRQVGRQRLVRPGLRDE